MQPDDFGNLVAHRVNRIERRHRLLKYNGNLLAADLSHLGRPERHEIASTPKDLPAGDMPGRHRDELEHRQRGDALAAAGFADHAQRLPAVDGKIDAIDRAHDAVVGGEVGLQPANFEEALARHGYITFRGSRVSRSPSPMKLIVSTARKIAAPGNSAQCGAMSR